MIFVFYRMNERGIHELPFNGVRIVFRVIASFDSFVGSWQPNKSVLARLYLRHATRPPYFSSISANYASTERWNDITLSIRQNSNARFNEPNMTDLKYVMVAQKFPICWIFPPLVKIFLPILDSARANLIIRFFFEEKPQRVRLLVLHCYAG